MRCAASLMAACVLVQALIAVGAHAAQVYWSIPTEQPCTAPGVFYSGTESIVIFACNDGSVWGVNGSTGSTIWQSQMSGSAVTDPSITIEGHLYFATGSGNVYSFNAVDGTQRWVFTGSKGIAQTAPLSVSNGAVFVGVTNGNVIALDTNNGATRWTDISSYAHDPSPVCTHGVVVFSLQGGVLADDTADESTVWQSPQIGSSNTVVSRMLGVGSDIFAPANNGNIYVLSATTGDITRKIPVSTTTPMAAGQGAIFVTTTEGSVLALSMFNQTVLWNTTGGQFTSAPVPADSVPVLPYFFVGGNTGVSMIDTRDGSTKASLQTNTPVTRPPAPDRYKPGRVYFATQQSIYAACISCVG